MQYYENITKNEILYAYNYLLYMNKYPGTACLHWYSMTTSTFKSRQKFPEIYDFGFLYPDMSIWFTPEKGKEVLHIREDFDNTLMKDIIKDMDSFIESMNELININK